MSAIDQFAPARAARMASLLLNRHTPQEIADAIEILVDVLDMMGGDSDREDVDPDLEDDDPREDDDSDFACDDVPCDGETDSEPEEHVAALSWGDDQTEPLPFDPSADRRIMATYRDRIRNVVYVKVASPCRGGQPTWRRTDRHSKPNLNP